jgi:hypothetical protein
VNPDPKELLEIAGIKTPVIGFYDVADTEPFKPFTKPKRCFFSAYKQWCKGESICISKGGGGCQGGGYWIGGVLPGWVVNSMDVSISPHQAFAKGLNEREGFKSSDELMGQWFENLKPYTVENGYVVIGPIKDHQYDNIKTVTFYVNPDQLSLLLLGAEYNNSSIANNPVTVAFGSGCGQMAALLGDLNTEIPKAVIGAIDIAMRENFPPDILAFTVNKPMYKQLCELDEKSFLYKHFWRNLKKAREKS